ncbi:MAG TPA: DUF6290 family protein [Ardenticatenaceae bacterium]|jgi:predicted DNA-binding protein
MSALTIHLPDELRQRAQALAAARGETVEALAQEALEEYLEELEDIEEAREILARIDSGEVETIAWEKVRAESESGS